MSKTEKPKQGATPAPASEKPKPDARAARAKQVFDTHSVDVVYFTHDDECFVNKSFAHMHANTLKDSTVTPLTRKDLK